MTDKTTQYDFSKWFITTSEAAKILCIRESSLHSMRSSFYGPSWEHIHSTMRCEYVYSLEELIRYRMSGNKMPHMRSDFILRICDAFYSISNKLSQAHKRGFHPDPFL